MKTSPAQFDLMVTFMEQHGDLSKPTSNVRGRIGTLRSWEELTALLNSDGSGDTKTSEKWKKVWSDYKNNTKKKAARLHKAVTGTGGGPATNINLTDLEQRVLNLIGVQAATGLAVAEAGLPLRISINEQAEPTEDTPQSPPSTIDLHTVQIEDCSEFWNAPGPSTHYTRDHMPPPPLSLEGMPISASPALETHLAPNESQPRPASRARPTSSPPLPDMDNSTVSRHVHVERPQPALNGQTPRRGRRTRSARGSPRRLRPRPHSEQAAEQFLRSDQEWRNFKMSQHRDYMDLRRDQNRIRELEVETQREWQKIGMRALDILEKCFSK